MTECQNCEYHKNRAARWRAEAYKQAGHDVIELPWVGLTDEDVEEVERWVEFKEEGSGRIPTAKLVRYIEAKLKEKNHG